MMKDSTMNGISFAAAFAMLVLTSTASAADDDLGARLYLNHCAACHGDDGAGAGPVASSLRVTVPDLRTLAQRYGGVFPIESVTAYVDGRDLKGAHGTRQMPIWGDVFRGREQGTAQRTVRRRIAAVVDYVSTLRSP
jgi:mono/diheme cytochrome c family protein